MERDEGSGKRGENEEIEGEWEMGGKQRGGAMAL